jgi:hypothetical protein
MSTGMQLLQGGSVLVTGILASYFALPSVVGWWSVGGVVMLLLVVARWPSHAVFAQTIEDAHVANTAAEAAPAPPKPRPTGEDPSDGRIRIAEQA